METKEAMEYCPICYKLFSILEIESHVNKCIFLNSVDKGHNELKRKRSLSPTINTNKQKCPVECESSTSRHKFPSSNLNDSNSTLEQIHKVKSKGDRSFIIPLSVQLQPKSLDQFFGQNHVLGKNTYLRSLMDDNEIPNMIVWGPPGCGKTSLANIIHEICKKNPLQYRYVAASAVDCGIKELQNVLNVAKNEIKLNRITVLFIDEIHRFNKKQQNTLLVQIIKSNIILIGATTENPSFILSESFLNRCKVLVMKKLETSHLISIMKRALSMLNIKIVDDANTVRNLFLNDQNGFCIQYSAVKWLAETTDGDARIALNNLQLVLQHSNRNKLLTIADIKDGLKKSHLLYDRNGEEHHNIISAMHESIKGYNDNATLYWTARMMMGGEDPLFIARRLIRAASEDTGNADPRALRLAVSTMHGCQLLGTTETDVLLAQCAVYLARAPTTKQTKSALALAKQIITESKQQQPAVPIHLHNIPTKLLQELGYEQSSKKNITTFMPDGLENVKFL